MKNAIPFNISGRFKPRFTSIKSLVRPANRRMNLLRSIPIKAGATITQPILDGGGSRDIKDEPLFVLPIGLKNLYQGWIADCWILAAEAGEIWNKPEYVGCRIQKIGYGQYQTYSFSPTYNSNGTLRYLSQDTIQCDSIVPSYGNQRTAYLPLWEKLCVGIMGGTKISDINFGDPAAILYKMGYNPLLMSKTFTKDVLTRIYTALINYCEIATIITGPTIPVGIPMFPQHCYTILAVDVSSLGVCLKNPHGSNDGFANEEDGIFWIHIADLNQVVVSLSLTDGIFWHPDTSKSPTNPSNNPTTIPTRPSNPSPMQP